MREGLPKHRECCFSPFLGEARALEPGDMEELRDTERASRGTRQSLYMTPAWNTPLGNLSLRGD